jgi:RNA polymerase sigma-70 factor (ECF subfamily)
LLDQWQAGDRKAEAELFTAMYDALRAIAARCVRNEISGGSLGPTALVHEVYLRFVKAENINLNGRSHFLALSAQVMRRILVDRARARCAAKRNGIALEFGDLVQTDRDADQIVAVDRAMEALSRDFPDEAKIVELRWFAGYSEDECASILTISSKTVQRRWKVARTRLKLLIGGDGTELDR